MFADNVSYIPSEWGARYHKRTETEVLGAGAMGPGKSVVLLWEPMMQVAIEDLRCLLGDKNPSARRSAEDLIARGTFSPELVEACRAHPLRWGRSTGHALHLRRVRPMLNLSISRAQIAFRAVDPDVHWDEKETTFTFRSGYKYQFAHCKDPNSWGLYQSNEYSIICWDELTQFDEEQYNHINLRLRSTDPVLGGACDCKVCMGGRPNRFYLLKIRSMSNPSLARGNDDSGGESYTVRDPNWVRKRFVEPHPTGGVVFKRKVTVEVDGVKHSEVFSRLYLRATIDDNPNKDYVRWYKARLADEGNPPHMIQAYLYGNWYVTAGSHFAEEWRESLHVCRPFKIPPHWKRFRSLDWGYKVWGTVGWFAMDEEGTLYLEREFNFRKMTADKVAERIRDIEKKMGLWGHKESLITGPADNQIWQQRGTVGKTMAETFADYGIVWTHADQKPGSRYNNARLVMERLADHDNGTMQPGLVIFDTCAQSIKTLPGIQSDPDDKEVPLEGGDDHWYDMIKYAVAYASHGNKGIPSPKRRKSKAEQFEDEDRDRDEERARKSFTVHLGRGKAKPGRRVSSPYQKRAA